MHGSGEVNDGPIWTDLCRGMFTRVAGFSVAMLGGLAAAGHAAQLGDAFWLGLAATGAHLAWQVGTLDIANAANCASRFKSNVQLGGLVAASMLAGKLTTAAVL